MEGRGTADQCSSKTYFCFPGKRSNSGVCETGHVRRNLHQNVSNIEDTQQSVELLALEIEVLLQTLQPRSSRGDAFRYIRYEPMAGELTKRCFCRSERDLVEYLGLKQHGKGTYIVENVDDDENRHACIQLAKQLLLHVLTRLCPAKLLVTGEGGLVLDILAAGLAVVGVGIDVRHST